SAPNNLPLSRKFWRYGISQGNIANKSKDSAVASIAKLGKIRCSTKSVAWIVARNRPNGFSISGPSGLAQGVSQRLLCRRLDNSTPGGGEPGWVRQGRSCSRRHGLTLSAPRTRRNLAPSRQPVQ